MRHGLPACMNTGTQDLVIQLLTQAGMLAEDIAAIAISSGNVDAPELATLLEHVQQQLERSSSLIAAGLALFDEHGPAAG